MMSDYKSMYFSLFNSVTDTIEILKAAQVKCENTYIEIDDDPPVLTLVNRVKEAEISQNSQKHD